jgi:hypothetical protein
VLHIPATYLDDIRVFSDQRDMLDAEGFSNRNEPELIRGRPEDFQAFLP